MLAARLQTIKTIYTTAIVDCMFFTVDTSSFTFGSTQTTSIALIFVDTNLEERKRLKSPKTVPTGQIVLHHVRPCFQARIPIIARVTNAIIKEVILRPLL